MIRGKLIENYFKLKVKFVKKVLFTLKSLKYSQKLSGVVSDLLRTLSFELFRKNDPIPALFFGCSVACFLLYFVRSAERKNCNTDLRL